MKKKVRRRRKGFTPLYLPVVTMTCDSDTTSDRCVHLLRYPFFRPSNDTVPKNNGIYVLYSVNKIWGVDSIVDEVWSQSPHM